MLRDWWHRRQASQANAEAARQRLQAEYVEKLDSGDPDALESSRDYGDNDSVPWKMEVGEGVLGIGMLILFVTVGLLILFFTWVQHLTGG